MEILLSMAARVRCIWRFSTEEKKRMAMIGFQFPALSRMMSRYARGNLIGNDANAIRGRVDFISVGNIRGREQRLSSDRSHRAEDC